MKLLIMQFPPTSRHFISLSSNKYIKIIIVVKLRLYASGKKR
jgi:hypothetical protein